MHTRLKKELSADINAERFDVTASGIYFPRQSIQVNGEYFCRHRPGGEIVGGFEIDPNLVVTEGMAHLLNVALGGKAKAVGYFLTLFSGTAAVAPNWTAASFAATANEITSMTEGYTGATRPAWTPADTSGNAIDNFSAVATFTIATASELTVTGAAMLTNNTRGGTTGALISASKYSAERKFQNNDAFDVGYRLSLTA